MLPSASKNLSEFPSSGWVNGVLGGLYARQTLIFLGSRLFPKLISAQTISVVFLILSFSNGVAARSDLVYSSKPLHLPFLVVVPSCLQVKL